MKGMKLGCNWGSGFFCPRKTLMTQNLDGVLTTEDTENTGLCGCAEWDEPEEQEGHEAVGGDLTTDVH